MSDYFAQRGYIFTFVDSLCHCVFFMSCYFTVMVAISCRRVPVSACFCKPDAASLAISLGLNARGEAPLFT